MTRLASDQPLVPSILDRLIDENPENSREPIKLRNQVISELRQSIRRDLENLLNTRWRCESWSPELTELDRSLVRYGIPDISAANLSSEKGRWEFIRIVEETIQLFEPRFKSVHVKFVENLDYTDRTLRFRIDAMLYGHPAPEPIVFDSAVEPSTGEFSVEGGGS